MGRKQVFLILITIILYYHTMFTNSGKYYIMGRVLGKIIVMPPIKTFVILISLTVLFIFVTIVNFKEFKLRGRIHIDIKDKNDKNKDKGILNKSILDQKDENDTSADWNSLKNAQVEEKHVKTCQLQGRSIEVTATPHVYHKRDFFSICARYYSEGRMLRTSKHNIFNTLLDTSSFNVTFVTQLTMNRFDRLEMVAQNWKGVISAAVYLEDLNAWDDLVDNICKNPHLNTRDNILYHVTFKEEEFYPVNYLRNVALDGAQTEWVFLVDIDLIPKPDMDSQLYQLIKDGHLSQKHTAWVIPAFETTEHTSFNLSTYHVPTTKAEMVQQVKLHNIRMFHIFKWPWAYNATLYDKWLSTDQQYEVPYVKDFEPYIVMRKSEVPRYREEFLSRYRNKVSHIENIYYLGNTFKVLPDAFVLHLPHADWKGLIESSRSYYKCAYNVYQKFRRQMASLYPLKFSELRVKRS